MRFKPEDDKKFYLEIPDPNFSPERNKAIVDGTIRKHHALTIKKSKAHHSDYMERADAVISYLKSFDRTGTKDLKRYFSPKYLAYLRGEDIKRELYARMTFLRSDGKEIFNPFK